MTDEVKRGPGRPPKAKTEDAAHQPGPPVMRKIKVKSYKVLTSQGRLLQNWERDLPEDEALALEASGDVDLC